jgi:hypothetical protein
MSALAIRILIPNSSNTIGGAESKGPSQDGGRAKSAENLRELPLIKAYEKIYF